ncbi:hypothetical protein QCA50_017774 [Cerrena zonata]|uniref:Uncharacterized protein n=1 Tax=Cerrena zonata TaxID=2478898 RepID=A0AAW0FEN4_9APHY
MSTTPQRPKRGSRKVRQAATESAHPPQGEVEGSRSKRRTRGVQQPLPASPQVIQTQSLPQPSPRRRGHQPPPPDPSQAEAPSIGIVSTVNHLPQPRQPGHTSIAPTPSRTTRPAVQNLRFAPSPEYEVIDINEDGWTESSGSRSATPTPPGPSQPHLMYHTPQSSHSPHTPQPPQTLHTSQPSRTAETPQTSQTPRTPQQPPTLHTPKSPRAGPHSQARAGVTKAKKKKNKKGTDVSTFFEVRYKRRYCIMCQQIHLSNPEHVVVDFSMGTSTSAPRKHLMDNHLAAWVDSCDQLKIPITAKGAEDAASQYRQQRDQINPSTSQGPQGARPEFSHEVFVNAIIE